MYLRVSVFPEAKKESVVKTGPDTYDIKVKAKPARNQANQRLLELLAGFLGVPVQRLRIVSGHHHRHKILNFDE